AWHARSGCTVGNEKFASQNAPPVGSIHSQFSFGYNPSKSSRVPHAIKLTLDAEDVGLLHMSTDLIAPHGRVPAVPYGVMLNELIFEPCGVPPFGPSDWTRVLDRRRIDRR